MPLFSGEIQLKQAMLMVKLLPLNSRDVTADEETITSPSSATAVGATSMTVTATGVDIPAGTALSFSSSTGRAQAVLSADAASGATTLNFFPLIKAIPASATAVYVDGLVPLFGLQTFSNADTSTTVDTTNTLSGIGLESASIRSDRKLTIEGIQVPGDPALYGVIKPVSKSNALFGREIYAVMSMPDGEQIKGAAKITNYSEPGNQNEVKKFSFELQFQGISYVWQTSHVIA